MLLDSTSTPGISVLDVALLALATGLAVALIIAAAKPVTMTQLETTSVLN